MVREEYSLMISNNVWRVLEMATSKARQNALRLVLSEMREQEIFTARQLYDIISTNWGKYMKPTNAGINADYIGGSLSRMARKGNGIKIVGYTNKGSRMYQKIINSTPPIEE